MSPLLLALKASPTPTPAATPAPAPTPAATPLPDLDLRDIAPPVEFFPYPWWQVALAAVLALALLSLLVYFAWRILSRPRPSAPPLLPRASALQALEALRASLATAEPRTFSFQVSEVLRRYVEGAYGIHALEQTTPEFLAAIAAAKTFTPEQRVTLAQFCHASDRAKFAGPAVDDDVKALLFEKALAFVQGGRA